MEKIVIDLEVNSNKGVKEVNKLNKSLKETDKNQKKIKESTNETSKALKKSSNSTQRNAAAFEAVNKATGGAIRGFRALIKQMWLLVANPVGAVIAAVVLGLTALYKAFTSTKAGGEQLERIMAGISATFDVVRDRVLKVGDAIIKFFSGDFSGAMQSAKESVSGFGDEISKEFNQAMDSLKSLQEVADAVRDLGVSRAKLNRDLIKAKEIIEGSTASYSEKKKAIDEVRIAETKQTEDELKNAKKKLDAIVLANSLSDSGAEDLDKEAQARISVLNLESISSANKTKFNKLAKLAHSQEMSRLKAIRDEKKKEVDENNANEKKKAEEKKKIDDKYNADKKAIRELEANTEEEKRVLALQKEKEKFDKAIALAIEQGISTEELERSQKESIQLMRDGFAELDNNRDLKAAADKKAIEDKSVADAKVISDAKIEISKREEEAKKASLNGYASALSSISGVLGQQTKEGKAIAIASSLVNTYASISGQLKAFSGVPIPGFAIAQAIATGVVGFANVKKIASVKIPNSGGGGSAPSGGGGVSIPSAPPSFNVVGASDTSQLADAIGSQSQEPVKAYVVSADVTTSQEMDRNTIEGASI